MLYVDYILTDQQRAALAELEVEVTEITIGTKAFHRHGISFDTEDKQKVSAALGLLFGRDDSRMVSPQGENMPGLRLQSLIDLPTPDRRVVLVCENRHDHDMKLYENMLAELRVGLVVQCFEYSQMEYRHVPGVLVINHYCMPADAENMEERYIGSEYCMVATALPEEYRMVVDDEGQPMACFRGDDSGGSLWLGHRRADRTDPMLMEYVLHSAARMMHPDLGGVVTYGAFQQIWNRRQFVHYMRNRLQTEIEGIGGRIGQVDHDVAAARQQLALELRHANAARKRRTELLTGDIDVILAESVARLEAELAALAESADFEELVFSNGKLRARTRPILIRHDGLVYPMGRYAVSVSIDAIRISSADGIAGDSSCCHPHVDRNGDACFGNVSEDIARMQADMNYSQLLSFLIYYLEHGYYAADCYAKLDTFHVQSYPEAEEDQDAKNAPDPDTHFGQIEENA